MRYTPMVERVCRQCLEAFLVPARQARRLNRAQFCGRSCQSRFLYARLWSGRDQSGPKNPAWKGGVSKIHVRYTRRFRWRYPERVEAQKAVQWAIRSGRLMRPEACSVCAVVCKPHGHHDDYTQPLSVRWLCRACHRQADAQRRAAEAEMAVAS